MATEREGPREGAPSGAFEAGAPPKGGTRDARSYEPSSRDHSSSSSRRRDLGLISAGAVGGRGGLSARAAPRISRRACAAVGGRVWRVVEASAVTGDIGVAELKRVLRHLCDMSDVSASILAPRSIGGVAGEACGASASLP